MQSSRSQASKRYRKGGGHGSRRLSWTAGKGEFLLTAAYLVVASLFGGGQVAWTLGNIVLVLATIALAVTFAWQDGFAVFSRAPLTGRIALAVIAVWPLLQLVPLPSRLWQALPGQDLRYLTLDLVGSADSWQPLTLEPAGTSLCALMAVGFVAFTGWLMRLSSDDFHRLFLVALGLVLLGILIGLLQVVSDGQFPQLQADNMGATLLGFFANKNHMALVLACSILLFGLVVSRQFRAQGQPAAMQIRRRLMVTSYTVFALVAIVVTNSRAGLGLGALAAVIVLLDLARGVVLRWRIAAVAVVAALVLAVMSSSAFEVVAGRVGDVSDDLRWRFIDWSWPLAEQYAWLGSGFGSFRTLFITQEQLAWVKPTVVNAVHNDYLQLLIEGGLPAMVLLVLLVLSLVPGIGALRRLPRRAPERHALLAGLCIIVLYALHSLVDYPLRRPAAWVFFALALAAVYRGAAVGNGDAAESPHIEAA